MIAGAVGDPPHSGLLVFRAAEDATAFADDDPYGAAGLVVEATVEPWTVVTRELWARLAALPLEVEGYALEPRAAPP